MSYFVIVRDDGKFVAPPGSKRSYTEKLQHARVFRSRNEADRDICPGNERVLPLEDAFTRYP